MPAIFRLKIEVPPKFPKELVDSFKTLRQDQFTDYRLATIFMDLESPLGSLHKFYKIYNGVLFFRRFPSSEQWLVCIPSVHELLVVVSVHEAYGHVGAKKCAAVLKEVCYFPNLHPLDQVFVDLYGPLPSGWNGVSYIFVILDNFSRFVILYPLKRATAVATTNRMIDHYIATYGKPKLIVSDHGVQFNRKSWQNRLSNLGIPPTFTSVYHPQSNPAERVMRELRRLFRLYCSKHHSYWPTYVPYIEWVLNHKIHEATGSTLFELFLQQSRENPLSVLVDFPTD